MDINIKPATDAGKIPTPQFPIEPPKEVKEMTFSTNPSLDNSDDSTIKIDHKEVKTLEPEIKKEVSVLKAPVEKIEAKKEPTKKEEKVEVKKLESVLKAPEKAVEKKEEPIIEIKKEESFKQITPVKEHKEDIFDYSSFTPQEQINLKNMSRQSREWASSLIKETKQLSSLKDSTYLQHEQGYTLSPEFQELRQKDYFARTEAQCWEQALLNIKQGKEFQDIVNFDKNGNPIMGEKKVASDRDEIRIQNNLSACLSVTQQLNGQLQVFPQRFKQQIQTDLQAIEQVQKEKFAWVQDPKLLDYSIDTENGNKKLHEVKSDFKSMLPIYLQNSPLADVASNLFVAMVIQGAELKEARNGKQIAEIKKEEASRGEPTSDNADRKSVV